MNALTNLWNNYTLEFSTVQKVIIAIVLAMIFIIALFAIYLVIMEIANN
jgi:cell division protein FtsL